MASHSAEQNYSRIQVWILAARPKTLWAAIGPVVIGTVLAVEQSVFSLWPALAALWGALWIQIGTNFANDYFDFRSGADDGARLGPMRVTQAGLVAPTAMKQATALAFALAVLSGIYLVHVGGWPILAVGLTSLLFGVMYTAGPYPLGYNGLGEAFVLVYFGPVAVAGTHYVQSGRLSWVAIVAGLAPGLLSVAILAVNNLRDAEADSRSGKRTLAVRFGKPFARWEYVVAVVGAALIPLALSLWLDRHWWSCLTGLILVAAIPSFRAVFTREGRVLNETLAATGKLLLLYTALFSIGWLM